MDEWTCDACPARAYVWYWRPSDKSEWKHCAHHANQHHARLIAEGHVIARDCRDQLLPAMPGEPPGALDGRVVYEGGSE